MAEPQPPSPALFWQPRRSRFPRWGGAAIAVVAVLFLGGALWKFTGSASETQLHTEPTADASATAAPSSLGRATTPRPKPTSDATATASSTAAARKPAPPADVTTCVAAMFPRDAFAREQPELGFVCKQRDPRKGAIELEGRLVHAQGDGDVTDGMKAWSILGWYEMAAFAFARTRCCPDARPLETPLGEICEFDASLRRLAIVANKGVPRAWDPQLDAYQKAAHCVINMKLERFFEWKRPVQGPERTAFTKMVKRARR